MMEKGKEIAVISRQSAKFLPQLLATIQNKEAIESKKFANEQEKELALQKANVEMIRVLNKVDLKKNPLEISNLGVELKDVKIPMKVFKKDANGRILNGYKTFKDENGRMMAELIYEPELDDEGNEKQEMVTVKQNINTASLPYINKNMGRDTLQKIIIMLIVNFNDYFNVGKGLNKMQIIEISEQVIETCTNMTLYEIVYIFQKAKFEMKLFDRLDGNLIFERIDQHLQTRGEIRHSESQRLKFGGSYESTYAVDLQKKFKIIVPEQELKRWADRDMMNSGVDMTPPKRKFKGKGKSKQQ